MFIFMKNLIKEEVHISQISVGDTVLHEGYMRTVSRKNLSKGFCGETLFGDSYKAGSELVTRVRFKVETINGVVLR